MGCLDKGHLSDTDLANFVSRGGIPNISFWRVSGAALFTVFFLLGGGGGADKFLKPEWRLQACALNEELGVLGSIPKAEPITVAGCLQVASALSVAPAVATPNLCTAGKGLWVRGGGQARLQGLGLGIM